VMPGPAAPSPEARAQHMLTHCPRARWCEYCVMGYGQDDPHTRVTLAKAEDRLPLIAMDYAFGKTSDESGETIDEFGTTLVVVDVDTMFPKAIPCESKAAVDYTVATVSKFIDSFFHSKVKLRTDGEPAMVALANKIKAEKPDRVVLEQTPKHSSASNPAERVIKDVEAMIRVMRTDLHARYGVAITANMAVWPWLVRHASWTLARFQPKASGNTPYRDAYDSNYDSEIVPFGETVLFRIPRPGHRGLGGKKRQHRADADWKRGVWCGRLDETNEHVLITPEGRHRARTVRRLEPARRADVELMKNSVGTPWNPQTGTTRGRPRATPQVATPAPPVEASGAGEAPARGDEPAGEGAGPGGVPEAADPSEPRTPSASMDEDVAEAVEVSIAGEHERPPVEEGSPEKRQRVAMMVREHSVDELDENMWSELGENSGADYVMTDEEIDKEATQAALDKLIENGVFKDIPRSEALCHKHITSRWEKQWRLKGDTKEYELKVRFVGREYKWQELRDDLFAPGATHSCGRIIDYLSLKNSGWTTFELDAVDAFYQAPEHENVVVDPPEEYLERLRAEGKSTDVVWKLLKQLPGRRPAGQAWVDHFASTLLGLGFLRCEAAPQFFWCPGRGIAVEVHMDDMHGAGLPEAIESFRNELKPLVKFKGGEPKSVGDKYMHLKRVRERFADRVEITPNDKYLDYVLEVLGLGDANPVPTPGVPSYRAAMATSEPLEDEAITTYRSCVGALLYYVQDREDCQYEVSVLGSCLKAPTKMAFQALKRVARYLKGTRDISVVLRRPKKTDRQKVILNGYSDSDWAGDIATRKSQSSGHIQADSCPLLGFSRRQSVIATSSGMAEYYAAAAVAEDLIMLRAVFEFFEYEVEANLFMDSAAARGMARREGVGKVKGLEVKTLWLQQEVKRRRVCLRTVGTEDNLADLGTKVLSVARLEPLRQLCGLLRKDEGMRPMSGPGSRAGQIRAATSQGQDPLLERLQVCSHEVSACGMALCALAQMVGEFVPTEMSARCKKAQGSLNLVRT
jgi:hypothetical protein